MTTAARTAPAPWHLWLVGILALLWNGFGAYDYVMSLTQGEAYYRASGMTDGLIAYYVSMPGWVYVPWTLGIGGAVIGTILLLLRSRFAVHAFVLSLLGSFVSNAAALALSNGAFLAAGMPIVPLVILIVCALLVAYSIWLHRRGVLR
jgi:hypothetical protein